MNYLAHAFLSGDDDLVLVGNMMGDAIKGNTFLNSYPIKVCDGILLHRFIDDFMDTHALTKVGKKRIWENYGHYSGVVMDMYYDHFLAINWDTYSDIPLKQYAQQIYARMEAHWHLLPEETKHIMDHMIAHDWLANYVDLASMERAFKGLSRRTKFISNMENAVADLYLHFDDFEEEFSQFFAEIRTACAKR